MRARTSWYFQAARLSDLAVSFGWQIVAARVLPVADFGSVAVATSVSSFAVIAISLGGDELMTSARRGALRRTFIYESRIRFSICAIACATAAAIWFWLPTAAFILAYTAATASTYLCIAYFTRAYRPAFFLAGVLMQILIMAAAFFIFSPGSVEAVLAILCVSSFARAVVSASIALALRPDHIEAPRSQPSRYTRLSLMASSASTPLLGRQLHVTIAAVLGLSLSDIGAYSAAYTLAYMAATATILGIGAMTMPRFADAASKGHAYIAPEWRRVLISTSSLALPAVVISMAVAPSLMTGVYGAEYGELGAWLYVGAAFALIIQRLTGGGATNALLVATNRATSLLMSILGSALALALADLVLMPVIGIWGAIAGSLVAAVAGGLITLYVVHRDHKILPPVRPQMEVLAISTATCVPLVLMQSLLQLDDWVILGLASVMGVCVLAVTRRLMARHG